jgi:prophage DNA circulation protein
MRNWMASLWPASFRGAAFWVKHDSTESGRRLSVTSLPDNDIPDIEDLGGKPFNISVTGYTLGDASDGDIAAVEAMCNMPGAGPLVLPAQGPMFAWCESFHRQRERDEQGKFTFEARFVLSAPTFGTANSSYLAQLTFDAAALLSAAAPAFLAQVTL